MIQSASILPLTEVFTWGRAILPGSSLTTVNTGAPVDVVGYRKRDQELAYRDIVLGALLTQVVIQVGDVWHFRARRPQLPATVSGEIFYDHSDAPATVSAPGSVDHVTNSSVPIDALTTDRDLYARDLILHESLRRAASILLENPIDPLVPGLAASEAWSVAEGVRKVLASVGYNLPLDVALFKSPDVDLAARDNQLAVFIAQLQQEVSDIFARAGRLLVKTPGQEPDTYVLTSETDEAKVWSAFPLLPDGRLTVRYDKTRQTVSWLGEQPIASNPAPQGMTIPVAGGDLTVIGSSPTVADAEFFRQKAARLNTRPYVDRIVFQTSSPELYLTGGGLYQPSSVLLPIPGQLLFSLPILIPAGCTRVGLHVMPTKFISVLGFLNRTRQADGTAVMLAAAGNVTFDVPLPIARVLMQVDITDKTARTSAFALEITANGNLVFDGAFTFNEAPGTSVLTQAFELDNSEADAAGPVTIVIAWRGGAGQLTINQLLFTTPLVGDDLTYSVSLQVGANQPTSPVQVMGVAERQDVVWFDTLVAATTPNPVLGVSFQGGNNAALVVNAYDLRIFDLRAALPNPAAYEPHKMSLALKALGSVGRAWGQSLATSPADPSTIVDGVATWDGAANARWLSMIEAKEPRLLQAFSIAGPGDIGRPALIPDGLTLADDGVTVLSNQPVGRQRPTYQLLQAWMLGFDARVAGSDFWPQADAGCASIGSLNAIIVTADFDWALTLPSTGNGYITFLSSVSRLTGSPDGDSFTAYTINNAGPSGGTVKQTVTLTAGLDNLNVGAHYTLTLSLSRALVTGGSAADYVVEIPVTSTAKSMSVTLPTIEAPVGYQVGVQSATFA